jgi:hypothetical protein
MEKKQTDKPRRRTQIKDHSKKERTLSKDDLKVVRGGTRVSKVDAITIKQTVVSDQVGQD